MTSTAVMLFVDKHSHIILFMMCTAIKQMNNMLPAMHSSRRCNPPTDSIESCATYDQNHTHNAPIDHISTYATRVVVIRAEMDG